MTTPTRDHKVARSYEAYGTEFDTAGANGRLDPLDLIPGPFAATDTQMAIEEVMEKVMPADDPWDETSNGSITANLLNDWSTKRFFQAKVVKPPASGADGDGGDCIPKYWNHRPFDSTSYLDTQFQLEVNDVPPTTPRYASVSGGKLRLPGPAIYKVNAYVNGRYGRHQALMALGPMPNDYSNGSAADWQTKMDAFVAANLGVSAWNLTDANVNRFGNANNAEKRKIVCNLGTNNNLVSPGVYRVDVGDYVFITKGTPDGISLHRHKICKVVARTADGFTYDQVDSCEGNVKSLSLFKMPKMIIGSSADPGSSVTTSSVMNGVIEVTDNYLDVSIWQYFNGDTSSARADFGIRVPSFIDNLHAEFFAERIG